MITISPSKLNGSIKIQPSKSAAHRAVICAALAEGNSVLKNIALSDDIRATLGAVRSLGLCDYDIKGDVCRIMPYSDGKCEEIFCCESGSTLRFLLPLAMNGEKRVFTGRGRLLQRPQEPYEELCRKNGIVFDKTNDGITVEGKLRGGEYEMRGDISSQFVSGLLFALPGKKEDSKILFSTPLESKGYIDLTVEMQKAFGVETYFYGKSIIIKGGQKYKPCDMEIEGDYSHAAFFAVGGALGGNVNITGLKADSKQGDREIFSLLKIMGADVCGFDVKKSDMHGIEIDVSQIPDLVPVLCVAACGAKGQTKIYNAARLRMKESDRLCAMTSELKKLGADITEFEDSLVINGSGSLSGGRVSSHADHRIAMSMAIASCIAKDDIIIDDHEVVKKSAPRFYEEFKSLGGKVK